jgi:hypothetical protein
MERIHAQSACFRWIEVRIELVFSFAKTELEVCMVWLKNTGHLSFSFLYLDREGLNRHYNAEIGS